MPESQQPSPTGGQSQAANRAGDISTERWIADPLAARVRPGTHTRRALLGAMLSTAGVALLAACGPATSAPTPAPAQPAATGAPQPTAAAAAPKPTTAPQPAATTPQPTAAAAQPPAAAAQPTAPAPAKAAGAPAATTAVQPRRGGTLRLGVPTDLGSLDGHVRSGGSVDSIYQVYDRLVEYDDKFTPQPMLAESWDVNADFTRIKFNLRKGVQFHNGREFTSDDVKWNLLRVRDPKIAGGNWVAQSNWFTAIETPDKTTLILSSDNPRPALFEFFENFNMLDKDTMEGPNAKDHAIGTGPFSLTEWVTGDHLAFSRNANYWQSGKPYADGFVANVRPAQTALTQLEAGALDMVKSPPVADIIRLQSDATYTNIAHPFAGSFLEFGINVTKPPFDNKKVRQALNYAINRQRFAEQIYRGTSVIQSLPWGPSSPAYDAAKNATYAFDLDKAKALLAEAGVSQLDMEAWVNANFNPQVDTFLQVYQADLATLGIRVTIKAVAAAEWADTVNNRRYVGIYASPDSSAQLSPSNLLNAGNAWRPEPANNSGFKDDTWTRLIAAANVEVDPAKQRELYAQINDFILDQSFVMPYSNQPVTFEARLNVHGMKPTLHGGGWVYTEVWLDA